MNLYNGDALSVLKTLDAESVQCCVTSPPYWGLRDYGVDPVVWDGVKGCRHKWGAEIISKSNDSNRGTMEWKTGGNPGAKTKGEKSVQGQFCQLCSAWKGCLGLEPTPELYVNHIVQIFREVRRVLKKDGVLWMNLGDSYAGSTGQTGGQGLNTYQKEAGVTDKSLKPKDLIGISWMVAFALRADGWWLRQDIIWHKPNPMPESVKDRCTKSHEYIFLMSKSGKYYYDAEAIKEPLKESSIKRNQTGWDGDINRDYVNGAQNHMNKYLGSDEAKEATHRNKRSVWTIPTKGFKKAHFATFPEKLVEPCILAGSKEGDIVLDPFSGAGTVGVVAKKNNREYIGIEVKEEYCDMARERIENTVYELSFL